MPYSINYAIEFEQETTPNVKIFDAAGDQVGSTITTGFVDLGYNRFTYDATFADGFRGAILLYDADDESIGCLFAVNPQELENADAKTSTRATPAQVNAEVDTALADYDAPTKAELDSAVAPLATAAALATVDDVVDNILLDTADLQAQIGTAGAGLTALGDTRVANLDATVSSRATPAQVNEQADQALADVGLTTTITGRIDAAVSTRATPAQVNAEVDAALADYDPPTKAELDSAVAPLATASALATVDGVVDSILVVTEDIQTQVGEAGTGLTALGDARLAHLDADISTRSTPAQVKTQADQALADVGLTTTITGRIDVAISTRATPAQVNSEVDAALSDYDPPTKAELDAAVAPLATASALATVDSVVDNIQLDTNDLQSQIGTAGAGLTAIGDARLANLDATVSSRATPAQVKTQADQAMVDYDPPTKAELDAAVASLATESDLTALEDAIDNIQADVDDLQAQIGTAGAGLTALGDTRLVNLDATVSSRATPAQVNSEVDAALSDYDPPTKAELDSAVAPLATATALATVDGVVDNILLDTNDLQAQIGTAGAGLTALGDARLDYLDADISSRATPAQVNEQADQALADVGLTTTITGRIDAAISTRATPAQVNAEVDTALADYDPPTKAELDNAVAPLANLDATVSSRATPAQVNTQVSAALATYDPPTKAELDAAVAPLATAANVTSAQNTVTSAISAAQSTMTTAVSTAQAAILSAIGGLNNLSAAQIWSYALWSGYTAAQALKAIRSVVVGRSIADDPQEPTEITYYAPDGATVEVIHELTDVTRDEA
jgi:phage baseplate assembly protein W